MGGWLHRSSTNMQGLIDYGPTSLSNVGRTFTRIYLLPPMDIDLPSLVVVLHMYSTMWSQLQW